MAKATDKQKESMKKYYYKNRDRFIIDMRKNHKIWYEKNKILRKKQISQYQKQKKLIDPNYKLMKNLRRLLNQSLIYYERNGKILKSRKYPINFEIIIQHLSPFPDRKIYEIDHIKPLCSFDLTDPEQIKIAFAPENHQWLSIEQNLKKGKNYDKS